jgi:hypothetical protein
MTTIITRLFKDEAAARTAARKLQFKGFPARSIFVIPGGMDAEAKMKRAEVHTSTAKKYAEALGSGGAVLAIAATYKPLGAARIAREYLAGQDTVDVGKVTEEHFVKDKPDRAPSVLKDHPRFFTASPASTDYKGGLITGGMGFRLLSKHRTKRSVMSGGRFMSRVFWPMPLLSRKPRSKSVMAGGRYMSQSFWPAPLISSRPRSNSVIKGGDLPFSRTLGWPPLS